MSQNQNQLLELSNYQDSAARVEVIDFSFAYAPTSVKRSIEILLEEIKPVATLKDEIQYEDESTQSNFQKFRTQDSDAKVKVKDFSIEFSPTSKKFSIEILIDKNQSCS